MSGRDDRQRLPAELLFAAELKRLRSQDKGPRPPGWQLAPRLVESFILGDPEHDISPKFVAPREVVTRVIISLSTLRGAMLVGEPGTAKSWLSELLCAAISGDSGLVIQGGAVETVQQLLYSWNSSIIEQRGICPEALVPGPLYRAMASGRLVRFEEMARASQQLQDALLSILSERAISIPELEGDSATLYAREGFNLVGTSNTADQGLNQMSLALKRRMNFEVIRPIADIEDEIAVVQRESRKLLDSSGVTLELDPDVLRALVTVFHELRNGQTLDGRSTDHLASSVMSTAEAVSVAHALGVHAFYYADGRVRAEDFTNFLVGASVKDNLSDLKRMNHYFDTEIRQREGPVWGAIYHNWKKFYRL